MKPIRGTNSKTAPARRPKTRDEITEMMLTGKSIDAAVRRTVRKARAEHGLTPAKAKSKSGANRNKRRAGRVSGK